MEDNHIWAVLLAALSLLISVAPIISAAIQRLSLFHSRKAKTAEFRLREIIYPLFAISEPYMKSRKVLSAEDAIAISSILQKNGAMIGNLLEYQQLFADYNPADYPRQKKYIDRFFCAVNAEFDVLSKELGIPKRSIRYRCANYRFVFARSILLSFFVNFAFMLVLVWDAFFLTLAVLMFFKTKIFPWDILLISIGVTFVIGVANEIVFYYLEK